MFFENFFMGYVVIKCWEMNDENKSFLFQKNLSKIQIIFFGIVLGEIRKMFSVFNLFLKEIFCYAFEEN